MERITTKKRITHMHSAAARFRTIHRFKFVFALSIIFVSALSIAMVIYVSSHSQWSDPIMAIHSNLAPSTVSTTPDLPVFLEQYKHRTDKDIRIILNPGNAGDVLIDYGMILLFDYIGISYAFGDLHKRYTNSILFYSGGGNLVGIYKDCHNFFKLNGDLALNNEIILLPHTIKDEDELIKTFEHNIVLWAREMVSFTYIQSIAKYKNNMFIAKDMAFYIGDIDDGLAMLNKYRNINNNNETLYAYRIDGERTNVKIPKNNIDISAKLDHSGFLGNPKRIPEISENFFKYISKYETVYTNRLHVSIASSLLHKTCFVHSNSYWKNEAIFNYSIRNKFKNTVFVKD